MGVTANIVDLAPKWLKFYALAKDADPDQRFALWQEHYRFAALPPTEHFLTKAREMLDGSFHRYPEALTRIEAGAAGFQPEPQGVLEEVSRALGFEGDASVTFVLYVGNFENNAFAATVDGICRVFLPLETDESRDMLMAHEFTHAIHDALLGTGGYVMPLAMLILREGLAMHASRAVVPGRPDWHYVSRTDPSWVDVCAKQHRAILQNASPYLRQASEQVMWQFTFGPGPTGLPREAYYLGWHVVNSLLARGQTLANLARLPEPAAIALVESTCQELAETAPC